MTIEDEKQDRPAINSRYVHDSAWELPEFAPVTILVSVGLLVLGSGISTWMSLVGQSNLPASFGWSVVTSSLRWIDPSTSTMLLISAALIWWQYGYWNSILGDVLPKVLVETHLGRLRAIAKWNIAAFTVTIASVVLLIVASILQNSYSGASINIWASTVETICMAVGTILLSLLGIVGLLRILAASHLATRDLDGLPI